VWKNSSFSFKAPFLAQSTHTYISLRYSLFTKITSLLHTSRNLRKVSCGNHILIIKYQSIVLNKKIVQSSYLERGKVFPKSRYCFDNYDITPRSTGYFLSSRIVFLFFDKKNLQSKAFFIQCRHIS